MTRTMDLCSLLDDSDAPALRITGVVGDSRLVEPGNLFAARRGLAFDGHDFVADAVAAGAVAVVSQRPVETNVTNIVLPELDTRLGELGARFHGTPSRELDIVGITGTNGKTTVAYHIAGIAAVSGEDAGTGYVGTLGWGMLAALHPSALTTADPLVMHGRLRELADEGVRRVAVEMSSHALDQGRVDNVDVDVGVFTNLTRDHLDYHGTMERYAGAKRRLFERPLRSAVVNVDDPTGRAIAEHVGGRMETFAIGQAGTVRWTELSFRDDGVGGVWITPWGRRRFSLPAYGEFSVYNAACAMAACCALGDSFGDVVDAMSKLPGVPGRMQAVAASPTVFVDFAHTPDGLAEVLAAIRSHFDDRVITVFGCGGDRDRGKRALMAQAVEAGSDIVVATSDNPRMEDPERILDDIMAGFAQPQSVLRVTDRRQAIATALGEAGSGDVVLIAGKGHEDYQDVAGRRFAWSDAGVVGELLGATTRSGPGRCPRRRGLASAEEGDCR